jgi:hypothetical protein
LKQILSFLGPAHNRLLIVYPSNQGLKLNV